MAFCNACGGTIEAGAKFCPKCGGAVSAGAMTATPVTPTPAQSSSGLKIILIVVGVLVALFVVGTATTAFIGWRIARSTHVRENNGNVKVETPFGTVESTTDSDEAARNLGVDVYPGATAKKNSAANMTIGGMHTVAAEFETSDSPDKVAEFYKSKFPNANFVNAEGDHYSIVSTDKKNMITINIEPQDGKTHIHIATVSGKPAGGDSSN
jgi:hypothetical protein